jgi:hypothetical protein
MQMNFNTVSSLLRQERNFLMNQQSYLNQLLDINRIMLSMIGLAELCGF